MCQQPPRLQPGPPGPPGPPESPRLRLTALGAGEPHARRAREHRLLGRPVARRGRAGPPDSGVITAVLQTVVTAGGLPLATAGSLCTMVNSVSGAPYVLPIGTPGASTGVTLDGRPLVRIGDRIPGRPGILTFLGPPAAPYVCDGTAP